MLPSVASCWTSHAAFLQSCCEHLDNTARSQRGWTASVGMIVLVAGIQGVASAKEGVGLEAYTAVCACRFPGLLAWQRLPPNAAEPDLERDPAGANASPATPYSGHRSAWPS